MVIQNLYETGSAGIISVGYTDVATGKSRTNLYAGIVSGAASLSSIVNKGIMSNVKFYSDKSRTLLDNYISGANINDPANRSEFDMDFDLPQTIEGQTIIQIPMWTSGATTHAYLSVGLEKLDSNNAVTGIASGATATLAGTGAILSLLLDTPLTHFKSGEKLRLRIQPVGQEAGAQQIFIGCDPMGRNLFTLSNGGLIAQVPFKVDL